MLEADRRQLDRCFPADGTLLGGPVGAEVDQMRDAVRRPPVWLPLEVPGPYFLAFGLNPRLALLWLTIASNSLSFLFAVLKQR